MTVLDRILAGFDSNWIPILKFAMATGFFTAVFNQGLSWLRASLHRRRQENRSGRELALDLVEILDHYAQECLARVNANRYDEQTGDIGRHGAMPKLREYPGGSGLLPPKLAVALIDLRSEVKEAQRTLDGIEEVEGPPEAHSAASYYYIIIGMKAVEISTALRSKYKLGTYKPSATSLSYASELRKHYRRVHPRTRHVLAVWNSLPVARMRWQLRRWRHGRT